MKRDAGCKPILARHHLFADLNQSGGRPVVWISGPPNSGKTTLVADYLAYRFGRSRNRTGSGVIWYAADPGKASRTCLGAAPTLKSTCSFWPVPDFVPDRETVPASFGAEPDAIVLDDIDHRCLRLFQAAAGWPARLTILICNRHPPIDMGGERQVIHIGWEQVRFSASESNALITLLCGQPFAPARLDRIHTHCAGWVGGLVMWLKSALWETGDLLACTDFIPEVIDDYFLNDIFTPLPADVREFLLSAAALPFIDSVTADILTQRNDSGALLERLYQENLFVEKKSAVDRHYRLHPMFRGFLQRLTQKSGRPRPTGRLLTAAKRSLRGHAETAFELFCDGADDKRKLRLIGRQCAGMLAKNQGGRLVRWIDALAPEQRESARMLHLKAICHLLTGDSASGRRVFSHALRAFQRQNSPTGMLFALDGLMMSILMQMDSASGLWPLMAELNSLCAPQFSGQRGLPEGAMHAGGENFVIGDMLKSVRHLETFLPYRRLSPGGVRCLSPRGRRVTAARLLLKALVQIVTGKPARAHRHIESALTGYFRPLRLSPAKDMLRILAGMCAWLSGRFGDARRIVRLSMDATWVKRNVNAHCLGLFQIAAVELSLNRMGPAEKKNQPVEGLVGGGRCLYPIDELQSDRLACGVGPSH